METIFDLATPEELVALFGEDEDDGYSSVRRQVSQSSDANFGWLASLYSMRGDMQTAESYVARIQNYAVRIAVDMDIHDGQP